MEEGLGTKDRILAAALEAYARHGIRDATVRQIAALAGIGKSTVFEYFKSSGELMDEAFARYIARTAEGRTVLRKLAETEPAAALARYFDSLERMVEDQPDKLLLLTQYITAIIASTGTFTDAKREYEKKLQPFAAAFLEDFRRIVESGMRLGAFRPAGGLDASDCALMISAAAREMQSQAFVQDQKRVAETSRRLRRIVSCLLGAADAPDKEE